MTLGQHPFSGRCSNAARTCGAPGFRRTRPRNAGSVDQYIGFRARNEVFVDARNARREDPGSNAASSSAKRVDKRIGS